VEQHLVVRTSQLCRRQLGRIDVEDVPDREMFARILVGDGQGRRLCLLLRCSNRYHRAWYTKFLWSAAASARIPTMYTRSLFCSSKFQALTTSQLTSYPSAAKASRPMVN